MKKTILASVIGLIFSTNSYAGMPVFDASNFAQAIETVKGIQAQIKQAQEYANSFKEYQQQFEKVKQLQEKLEAASDAIRDNDLNRAINNVNGALGFGASMYGRATDLASIEKELTQIESKLSDPNISSIEKGLLMARKSELEVQKTLVAMLKTSSGNVGKMSRDESVNESHRINATNTSMLARLAVEANQRENDKEMQQRIHDSRMASSVIDAGDMFEKLGNNKMGGF